MHADWLPAECIINASEELFDFLLLKTAQTLAEARCAFPLPFSKSNAPADVGKYLSLPQALQHLKGRHRAIGAQHTRINTRGMCVNQSPAVPFNLAPERH